MGSSSFKDWARKMKRDYTYDHKAEDMWRRIQEDWLVSTKQNDTYQQRAFHICYKSWKNKHDRILRLDEACKCGEVLPEGVRMVSMLLESL